MKTKPRAYNSTRRTRQAAQTREEIVAAAIELFSAHGWAGTTLGAIAERAGVSVETIYATFGSKKALLKSAMGVAVVGDTEEVPLAERSEWLRMGEGTLDERLQAAATLTTDIHERTIGVWRAVVEAARSDEEVERWRAEMEAGRRLDVRRGIERVLGHQVDARAVDLLWAFLGPEVYVKLTLDAEMSRAQYEQSLIDAMVVIAGLERAPGARPRGKVGAARSAGP